MKFFEGRLKGADLKGMSIYVDVTGFMRPYIRECQQTSTSIIYQFSAEYAADTSEGIERIWRYEFEFQVVSCHAFPFDEPRPKVAGPLPAPK